jgi:hypothetical protein
MQTDPESAMAVQPELVSGETLIWAGRPSPRPLFHKNDVFLVPFSLMWGGFAILWLAGVAGLWGPDSSEGEPWTFGIFWGIPFVLIGQYFIWGRFIYAAWKKKGTYYAVTNRRVMVIQNGWGRKMVAAYLDTLPTLYRETTSGKIGTLRFAEQAPVWSQRNGFAMWDCMAVGTTPAFVDVEDVDGIYRLVSDLRTRAKT